MPRGDFRFFYRLRVRYSEIDAQSIVFNAHYLTYFDTALTEYFRMFRIDFGTMHKETGCDVHVVRSVIEYKAPIRFDEEIDIGVRVARIGRSSLLFVLEIHGADTEDLRAAGEIIWVHADQATHKSVPWSDAITGKIAAYEGELKPSPVS